MLGKTLDGKHRIQRLLGSGGMGSVYAAEDVRSGRMVAVKVIHKNLADGAAVLARFQREAQAAGSIDTEHIARCFDTGVDPETASPYMVLEYLVGEDLQHMLRRLGPLGPDVALRITAQACIGVAKAHEASVFHRDIKPANIFLAKSEEGARIVKVLDFGVAKIRRDPSDIGADSTSGGLTRTGSILGSPLYMSPEQARSVKNVDHRSDVWSLGVVLYQSVAGRTPYEHISGLGDLILALCSDLPPPVQQFAPWVGPEVAALIDRALRIDPSERFQSAGEMVDAVRALCPDGIGLRDDMLTALDDATHDHIAPTYFRNPGRGAISGAARVVSPESLAGTQASLPPERPDARSGERALGSTPGGGSQASNTTSAVATTGPGLPDTGDRRATPAAPRQASFVAVAIACVLLGGVGAYALLRSSGPPVEPARPPPVLAAIPTATPTTPAPPATAALTVTAGATAAPVAPVTPAPTASATAEAAPTKHVPGPMPTGAATHGRAPATTAAPTTTPTTAPPDYSSFGGRK